MQSRTLFVALISAALILPCADAFGGYGGGGGKKGSKNAANAANSANSTNNGAVTQAGQDVSNATADANQSNDALTAIVAALRHQFEQTGPWKDAQAEMDNARIAMAAARAAVLVTLGSQPDYQAAVADEKKAEAERDRLQKDTLSSTPEDRAQAASAVFDAVSRVKKLENDAMALDPKVMDAKVSVADAAKEVADALKKFNDSLPLDPNWQAARKDLDAKKQAVADAQKRLADTLAQGGQGR